MSIVGILLIALALVAMLVLGGVAGDLVARDPGYVLITYDGLAMETSLWIAAAGLVLGLLLLWLLVFLVIRLLRSWGMLGRWSSKRRRQAAANRTTQGVLLMAEGQWAQAQRALVAAAPHASAPLPNYLAAARAAAAQDLADQRDELLTAARESTPGSALAVGLVQAELQQQAGEWQSSLTLLREMRDGAPKHPGVQRLLLKTLQQLGRHDDVLAALDAAKKAKALSKKELADVEANAYTAQLAAAVDAQQLGTLAANLPKSIRSRAGVATALGRRALALQQATDDTEQLESLAAIAEPRLRGAIEEVGTDAGAEELVKLYGRLQGENKARAQALQRWQKKMPQFPALLLAGAQVAVLQGDLPGAQAKVEQALAMHAGTDGHLQMVQLCCANGDPQGALAHLAQLNRSGHSARSQQGEVNLLPLAVVTDDGADNEANDGAASNEPGTGLPDGPAAANSGSAADDDSPKIQTA